ncbi:MAG: efflux RND transporter periplasmic adaptor subunit [Candidatus Sericytochromatia bacterium]|nr:efflux RND transporter periplasmic adaptor subunit [Candidatus Sericytochromatia bacterium]
MARWMWIGAVCLTVGGAVGLWWTQAGGAPRPSYTTAIAERGPIEAKVSAAGTVSALVTVQVGSQVSGRIANLYVDFNDTVRKGQTLARLDPRLFEAELARAEASEVSARSALARARIDAEQAARQLARSETLWGRRLIARADLDAAQASADVTRAQVEAARAQVSQAGAQAAQARLNLAYTTIASPIDGTVIARSVDVGQTVAASLQAPTLFQIAQDLRKAQVLAAISEADVGKIRAGMPAEFTVAAYPGEPFLGKVRQLRNAARTEQNVVTYDAVIDVDNAAFKLRPGMTANVAFTWAAQKEALRVPNAALRFSPAGEERGEGGVRPRRQKLSEDPTRRRVWVLRGGEPVAVPVQTGITDGSQTEIVSGDLQAGDAVVTEAAGDGAAGGGAGRARSGGPRMRF